MKYLLLLVTLFVFTSSDNLSAQSASDEGCFMTMILPSNFIRKQSDDGKEHFESNVNRSRLIRSKEFKGAEDGFISAKSAADFARQTLEADKKNIDLQIANEKIGSMHFTVLSWVETGDQKLNRTFLRAYNDDGQYIHSFEMNSNSIKRKALEKGFRSILRSCKPIK